MTQKLYLAPGAPLSAAARIVEIGTPDNPFVVLDRTVAHAQGGGQPADRGLLNGKRLAHVRHREGVVEHVLDDLDGLHAGLDVTVEVDGTFRRICASYHTFGHLLAGAAQAVSRDRLVAEQGHQWPSEARVEFRIVEDVDLATLEDELMARVEADLDRRLEIEILDLDGTRAVRIGEYAPIPCGGTHLAGLDEMPRIFAVKARTKKGRLKINYALSGAAPFEQHDFSAYPAARRANRMA